MLLNFKVKNFKSISGPIELSLQPSEDISELRNSILEESIGEIKVSGLSTAIIYGPNSIGKTNLFKALDFLRAIILNKGIYKNGNSDLHLIPNLEITEKEYTEFEITFIQNSKLFRYLLTIDFGVFNDVEYKPRFIKEEFWINQHKIFLREMRSLSVENKALQLLNLEPPTSEELKKLRDSLDPQELFLFNGFRLFISKEIPEEIYNWFENRLIIILDTNSQLFLPNAGIEQEMRFVAFDDLNGFLEPIGSKSSHIGYYFPGGVPIGQMASIIKVKNSDNSILVPSEKIESLGTQKFTNLFPVLVETLRQGGTLVIDEFDSSIHSTLLMALINVFHDREINNKNAQLIFNTHNPVFMSDHVVRRDEINLMDLDEETNLVELYTLSDFLDLPNQSEYFNEYLDHQYGALKHFNLKELFEKAITNHAS